MGNDPLTTKLRKPYQDKKKPKNQANHQKSEHESLVGVIACGGCTSLGREGPGEVGGCAGVDPHQGSHDHRQEEQSCASACLCWRQWARGGAAREGLAVQLLALVQGRLQDLGALGGDEDIL